MTSSEVSGADGSYSHNFLAEGDHELVFLSYTRDGEGFFFNSMLEVESTNGLDLGAISVTAATQISANVTVTGTKLLAQVIPPNNEKPRTGAFFISIWP